MKKKKEISKKILLATLMFFSYALGILSQGIKYLEGLWLLLFGIIIGYAICYNRGKKNK